MGRTDAANREDPGGGPGRSCGRRHWEMIAYLDANCIIYLVEQNPAWCPQITARLVVLRAAGDELATSDFSRTECLVGPFASGDNTILASYQAFFSDPALHVLPLTAAVC